MHTINESAMERKRIVGTRMIVGRKRRREKGDD